VEGFSKFGGILERHCLEFCDLFLKGGHLALAHPFSLSLGLLLGVVPVRFVIVTAHELRREVFYHAIVAHTGFHREDTLSKGILTDEDGFDLFTHVLLLESIAVGVAGNLFDSGMDVGGSEIAYHLIVYDTFLAGVGVDLEKEDTGEGFDVGPYPSSFVEGDGLSIEEPGFGFPVAPFSGNGLSGEGGYMLGREPVAVVVPGFDNHIAEVIPEVPGVEEGEGTGEFLKDGMVFIEVHGVVS
jgi:hypothetical protein